MQLVIGQAVDCTSVDVLYSKLVICMLAFAACSLCFENLQSTTSTILKIMPSNALRSARGVRARSGALYHHGQCVPVAICSSQQIEVVDLSHLSPTVSKGTDLAKLHGNQHVVETARTCSPNAVQAVFGAFFMST